MVCEDSTPRFYALSKNDSRKLEKDGENINENIYLCVVYKRNY